MKKIYTTILMVLCALNMLAETEFTFTVAADMNQTKDAYFGVMADQKITFTATQVIKGIAIHGNVRKNFSASCDRGSISYLTDEDVEMAGDPVLVIRNINDISVTITCDKNLSCYGARVYFEENPDSINDEAGIEDVQSSNRQSSIRKFVKDRQLYILRENKTYTIIGTQL